MSHPSPTTKPNTNVCASICSRKLFYQLSDGSLLILLVIFQSSVLNFFIIDRFNDTITPYFWFVADLLCVLFFAGTLSVAYRNIQGYSSEEERIKDVTISPKALIKNFPINKLSKVPLCYCSWLLYGSLLVAKIVVIYKADIPETLENNKFFGPQLLKLSIGLSAVVFALLVEGHHDAQPGSSRNGYIMSVCIAASFDIIDTVSFLSILHVNESRLLFTFTFENVILVYSCLNLLLPAVTLYQLSLSEFGAYYHAPVAALYKFLHLSMVNIPYLTVRLYLWSFYESDISMFLVKNIFSIIILLRGILPDLIEWMKQIRATLKHREVLQRKYDPGSTGDMTPTSFSKANSIEMEPIGNAATIPNGIHITTTDIDANRL